MAEGGASTSGTQQPDSQEDGSRSAYECNICLDTAKDAVVSMCGHLFCWPCLHTWLETRRAQQVCPVCKAGISKDKVIPLYGRGSTDSSDPRDKMPPRPPGQRSDPEPASPFGNMNMGFQMSFGIGAFPFTFFNARTANIGDPMWQAAGAQTEGQRGEEMWLSRFFLCIALFFGFWLLIA